MKQLIALIALGAMFVFGACQTNSTPEEVVRQWQAYIDSNNFEEAKKLSTQATADLLDLLAGMIPPEMMEEQMGKTEVLEVSCEIEGEKATCSCRINYDGQEETDDFFLVMEEGQWKVDLPDNPMTDGEFDFDDLDLEEMEGMLEEQLETAEEQKPEMQEEGQQ